MKCPECGYENSEGARICVKCYTHFNDDMYVLNIQNSEIIAVGPNARAEKHEHHYHYPNPLPVDYLCQAPPLPQYFVPRPEVSQVLLDALLYPPAAVPGILVVSAVHGLGGIGKTTLAAALAYEPRLREYFKDGILWATLGQQPNVLALLSGWIQTLGDYAFHPLSVDAATTRLRSLLHEKACLLVVDDAWNAEHVRPFLAGGTAALITTRDITLVHKISAKPYDLDVMKPAQALALFETRLGELREERDAASALAKELGYLPLALELATAQVEDGRTWDELLHCMRQDLADLGRLDLDEATYRNESLRVSFRLSLGSLSIEDQEAFVWLGVVPEDVFLNNRMASTLWDCALETAAERLQHLCNRSLLKNAGQERYILHDLLHDEARLRLSECMPMVQAHAVLLERYAKQCSPGELPNGIAWHSLPDDGYSHAHLTWHMERAGQAAAVHVLLKEQTRDGRNGWYVACERLGLIQVFVGDVRRAWELARQAEDAGLECRYALMMASLGSLASNIPTTMLVHAVNDGVWTLPHGLAYARQKVDVSQRSEALRELAMLIQEGPVRQDILLEALGAARQCKREVDRIDRLSELIGCLSGELKEVVLQESLDTALKIGDDKIRSSALMKLSRYFDGEKRDVVLRDALAAADRIKNRDDLAKILNDLAGHFSGEMHDRLLGEALYIARKESNPFVLAKLARQLEGEDQEVVLREVVDIAKHEFLNEGSRAVILSSLAGLLSGELLQDVLNEARQIRAVGEDAWVLNEVGGKLSGDLRESVLMEALDTIRKIEPEADRAHLLISLGKQLGGDSRESVLREALAAARKIEDEHKRASALDRLANQMDGESQKVIFQDALKFVQSIQDEDERSAVLSILAGQLSEDHRGAALHVALDAARRIRNAYHRATALSVLAGRLNEAERESVFQEALAAAREIEREPNRIQVLGEITTQWAIGATNRDVALREALGAARQISDESARFAVWSRLVKQLDGELLQEELSVARGLSKGYDRSVALGVLAGRFSGEERDAIVQDALASTRRIWVDDCGRAMALSILIEYLHGDERDTILRKALGWTFEKFGSEQRRAIALRSLVRYLDEGLLRDALDATLQIMDEYEYERSELLVALAEQVKVSASKGGLLQEILFAARRLHIKLFRSETLSRLAEYLDGDEKKSALRDALDTARQIDAWYSDRAMALGGLAGRLDGDDRKTILWEALTTALQHDHARFVMKILAKPFAELPPQPRRELWQAALPLLAAQRREELLDNLADLFPLVQALGGEAALAEVFCSIQDVGRWWP